MTRGRLLQKALSEAASLWCCCLGSGISLIPLGCTYAPQNWAQGVAVEAVLGGGLWGQR